MRCVSPSLFRRFWGLLPQYVSVGPSQSPNLSSNQSSLRQSCSVRPGLLTAPDVVSYWQKVFEKNGIPEARESSEYIVSFVLGAKTVKSWKRSTICVCPLLYVFWTNPLTLLFISLTGARTAFPSLRGQRAWDIIY